MNDQDKTKEELIIELQELRLANASLKATIETDLLSYKPTEEALQLSEERFQLLFNKFPLGYQSLDSNGDFMEVNQHWLDMLGYERDEVIGKWYGDFLSLDYQEGFRKQFPIFKSQGHIHFEFEMVHKNGSVLYIAFEGVIGYNIKGDFEQAHCIIQDITKRRQIEQALRESQNRLNEAQKLAHIGVWDWDAKNDRVIWSDELYQLSGIDPGLSAPSFAEHPKIYTPESWIILKTAVENTMKTGELYQLELDLIRTDGTIRNVKAFGGAKYDTLGQFVGLFGTLQDITEGKLSESIFKDIIEKNPMSVQILNMEGYVIQTNSAHTKLFGVSPPANYSIFKDEQLVKQGLGDLFEQIKKGKVVYFPDSHYNVHDVDPSFPDFPVWIKAIGFTLNNKNGKPDRIVLMHENITERRNAEALLNDIIDKNPMSIQIVDKDGFTLRGNPAYIQLFGTLPPPNFSIFADLESKGPELEKLISRAKNGEIVHLPDIYFNAHDVVAEAPDIPLWIRALIFPLKDSGGKSQRFVFMHENITERKKSEQELIAAKQKAEESEEKYKQIFDNTFDIMSIYEVTEDGRFKVLTFNAAEAKLVGPLEYYQNRYVDDCIPPHLYAQFKRNYERCIKEEKLIVYEEDVSFQEINKTFNTQLIPLKNNEGRIHRIIVISRDITENKLLQTQLIDQNEKLKLLNTDLTISKERAEESDRLKTAFLQNMSHEIRTPMNAIMGFSSLLVKNYNNKLKLEKFSTIINQRCNDLLDIINDILDISKIESGQLPVNMEECNLSELFAELLNFFYEYQNRIGKQHINFSLQTHCSQLDNIIVTDKGKLKQIFINLISNAFKFTESGTIEGGCKYDTNHKLVFYLTDTGIGIPPDKQKIVFERFAQLPQGNMQNIGGTGLGLSIVKGLVGLLGGEIFLESKPNKGSSFSFTFPYKTSHSLQAETFVSDAPTHYNILHKTILIVEDDQYNAEYLKEILSDNGLNILLTDNGLDAIEICLSKAIDLVLMDIRLPDMNGYEVTKEIRKHKPLVKIIAQTAYAAQDEKQKAFHAGCCDYVSKPTRQDLLLSVLSKHLS